jgi:hypothetical protein
VGPTRAEPAKPSAPPAAPQPAAAPRSAPPARRAGLIESAPAPLQLSGGAGLGQGQALPAPVRATLEQSLGVDLAGVQVHTGAQAASAAAGLSARAFAYSSQIVLGAGERPTDLGLMAHEVANVVQQRGAPAIQRSAPGQSDAYEREAQRASAAMLGGEPFSVRERTSAPRVQGFLGIDLPNPLNYLADKANNIPGFRMFTIVLGVNPINMNSVPRTPANIMRALVEFIPGGNLITQALDNHGVFEKVGAWVEQQLGTLGLVGSSIKKAISEFIDSLGVSDLGNLGGVWERAKRIFTDPIDRIINFAKGLVSGIITFIKDAILMPLAKLAEGTRGWDLLTAVLGKNPITGEPVPRNAETLIGGFMKLIGQEEVWENMKKANAIARAWAWFQGAMNDLMGFVQQIPTLAINAFKALELVDIVLVPRAFMKVAAVFGDFIGKFIGWAGNAVWNLLEIIFAVVAPGALTYIKRTGAALKSILKNPLPFVGNLVKAAKLGFQNFANRFGEHLKAGLIGWLTGSLPGIYIPKAFTLGEIVKFVFSVLGLTWQNVRQKLVKVVGETAVKAMEAGFDIVITLVTQGPAAAWEKIKDQLANLKDMVIGGITDFVIDTVVKKAIPKLVAMFIPGAGFISAIISIYDTIMVFVNKISQIIQVVTGFIDSIVAIAGGVIDAAAKRVESTLANLLSLAISFLAGFIGLGKVADKIMGVINKVRQPIDKALDALINWIVTMAKKLFAKVFGKDKKDERTEEQKKADLKKAMGEATSLLKAGNMSHNKILKSLPSIKSKYKLTGLDLVVDKDGKNTETAHIRGIINPEDKTSEANLIKEPPDPKRKPIVEVKGNDVYVYDPAADEGSNQPGLASWNEGTAVVVLAIYPNDVKIGGKPPTEETRMRGGIIFTAIIDALENMFREKIKEAKVKGAGDEAAKKYTIKGVEGSWNPSSDNTKTFNQVYARRWTTLEAAAKATFTGGQALKRFGFDKVTINSTTPKWDDPSVEKRRELGFTHISCVFHK